MKTERFYQRIMLKIVFISCETVRNLEYNLVRFKQEELEKITVWNMGLDNYPNGISGLESFNIVRKEEKHKQSSIYKQHLRREKD